LILALLSVFIPAGERTGRGTLLVLSAVTILALAGCGGGDSIDPETTVRTLVEDELVKNGLATDALRDVACVEETSGRFQCVVTVAEGGEEQRIGGTLTCDSGECIWRGQFAGG
jgi:hypothetical protein